MVSSAPSRAIGNKRYKPLTDFKRWFRLAGFHCLPPEEEGNEEREREEEEEREGWQETSAARKKGIERNKNNRGCSDAAWLQSDSRRRVNDARLLLSRYSSSFKNAKWALMDG